MQTRSGLVLVVLVLSLHLNALGKINATVSDTPYIQLLNKQPAIGDILPLFTFGNVLRRGQAEVQQQPYPKGKYVIIDFFATWCTPCIKALKGLDSLQNKYPGNLAIFIITTEDKATVSRFLKNNQVGRNVSLPFVVADSILNAAFPHSIVPHEVWIDRNRKVVAITSDLEVTPDNVAKFVTGQHIELPEKSERTDYDYIKPLFVNGNGGADKDFLARSILARTDDGLGTITGIMPGPNGTIARIVSTNAIPVALVFTAYAYAYDLLPRYNKTRVIFEMTDTSKLFTYAKSNRYTYELSFPKPVTRRELSLHMLEDLNRYFDFSAAIEKRKVACWMLEPAENAVKYPQLRTDTITIQSMIKTLNNSYNMEPVILQQGVPTNLAVSIDVSLYTNKYPDINLISKELLNFGLKLTKAICEMDVLVIRDK